MANSQESIQFFLYTLFYVSGVTNLTIPRSAPEFERFCTRILRFRFCMTVEICMKLPTFKMAFNVLVHVLP